MSGGVFVVTGRTFVDEFRKPDDNFEIFLRHGWCLLYGNDNYGRETKVNGRYVSFGTVLL